MSNKEPLGVGSVAPDFTLKNQNGETVSLSDYKGKKNVVLFFYPKDQTPGCTKEACSFRDNYELVTELGAEVIGINGDSESSHKAFATKHNLPYHLVSDNGGSVRKAYGVPKIFFLVPARVTFVIDKEGIIKHVFRSDANAEQHIEEAISVLKEA